MKRRIVEIDTEKRDLTNRLLELEKKRNLKDPNFDSIDVPESPKKSDNATKGIEDIKHIAPVADIEEATFNVNEDYVREKVKKLGTTSYFTEKLRSINTNEHEAIKRKKELLAHRVYTFNGDMFDEYEPITVDEKDDLSGLVIDRRYVPLAVLRKHTKNIKVLRLPKLFSKVRAPKFSEPDYPNWLVLGIISKKTEPRMTNSVKPVKFFSLTISDFQFELNVIFFGKSIVEKYYKLRLGDLIAILNPEIMPSKKLEAGASPSYATFSLKVSKDTNNILELGHSKEFGLCQFYMKNKGKLCGAPINKLHDNYCAYHKEAKMRQNSSRRVEISSSVAMRAPVVKGYQQTIVKSQHNNGKTSIRYQQKPDKPFVREPAAAETNRFLFSSANASTAFFDDDYENPDILANLDNKRRKIQELRNNRNLEKKLKGLSDKLLSKKEDRVNQEAKKTATLSMFQHGLANQIGYDPTKGKASLEMLEYSTENKAPKNDKQLAITDICNIKKDNVSLKPSKKQLKEKIEKRNAIFNEIMKGSQERLDKDEGSSDDLEII